MIRRRYRCPACERLFDYDHHPSITADPLPAACPWECGYATDDTTMVREARADFGFPDAVMTPHLATNTIVKSVDGVYRGMEEGSKVRAEMAAEHGGLDASEAAGLRMTDMRDNLHAGDTSDVPVNNAVTQMMAAAPPGSVGFQSSGLGYSSTVGQGPYPNAGLRAMLDAQRSSMFGPPAVSRPALETLTPGYKRRA